MRVSFVLFAIFFSQFSFSYIPDYKMIMSRVAENHGHGFYKIVQDVVFPAEPEPLIIEETWIVGGEHDMTVTLKGKGILSNKVSGTIVYESQRKIYKDSSIKTARLPEDFIEPLFQFRFSKNMKPKLVTMKVAPAESLKDRPPFHGEKTDAFPVQSFVRLSRSGGVVTYAIGKPTPSNQTDENPGLWIEQDRFHIRKLRTESNATVTASGYSSYPRKMFFPQTRQYSWDNHTVQVLLGDLVPLPSSAQVKALMSPKVLNENSQNSALSFPEVESIRDFYKRFR